MIDRFTNKNLYSLCLKISQPVLNGIPTDNSWFVGKALYLTCILAIAIFNGLLFLKEMNIHLLRTIRSFNTLLLIIFLCFGYVLLFRLKTSQDDTLYPYPYLFPSYVVCFILFLVQYSLLMTIKEWTTQDTKEQSKKTYIQIVGVLNSFFVLFIILGGMIQYFC